MVALAPDAFLASRADARADALEDNGFALVELLIVVAIIGILAAIASGGLLRARLSGNEASALGSLRAIQSAQSTFSSTCGGDGFAQSLEDLAKPGLGSTQGFISPDLASNGVVKSGYYANVSPDMSATTVTVASRTCNGSSADAVSSFFAEAHPVVIGGKGQRSFAIDARRDRQDAYVARMREKMRKTVWQNAACTAFYRKNMTEEVTSLSPEPVTGFILSRKWFRMSDYRLLR